MLSTSPPQIPPLPDNFLLQSTDAINAQEIMAKIRRRIAEKQQAGLYRGLPRLALDTPPPPGAARRVEERLALLHSYARPNLEGEPIASHRPLVGKFIVKFKKFMRFWVRRYTDTIFLRQQMYNDEVAALLEEAMAEIKALRQELESRGPKIEDQEEPDGAA
jgi:hypothetical protein